VARGDRKWSLNDGQIPNFRDVRVHVSAGYNLAEVNRRASRNGLVSSSPTRNLQRSDSLLSPNAQLFDGSESRQLDAATLAAVNSSMRTFLTDPSLDSPRLLSCAVLAGWCVSTLAPALSCSQDPHPCLPFAFTHKWSGESVSVSALSRCFLILLT
jgi:hypothetical protein